MDGGRRRGEDGGRGVKEREELERVSSWLGSSGTIVSHSNMWCLLLVLSCV